MEIRTNDEKYVLTFWSNPPVTFDHEDQTVEVEIERKELLSLREKIDEILKKEGIRV